ELAQVRAWAPEVLIGQQWATEEASRWATAMGVPFVMLVHGPGQYEVFRPQCDLVVFNGWEPDESARSALGATPAMAWPRGGDVRPYLLRVAEAGRRRPTLALCMTVANEGATLEKAVNSVQPFVDQVVIGVDRRSTDETAAIARRLATHSFEFTET